MFCNVTCISNVSVVRFCFISRNETLRKVAEVVVEEEAVVGESERGHELVERYAR